MPDWRTLPPARWLRRVGHRGPVRITIGDPPRRVAVTLDGVDATDAIRGFQLIQEPGEFPTLLLELPIYPAEGQTSVVDCAATEVLIPESTAQLLTRAGWTPPADDDATSDGEADDD